MANLGYVGLGVMGGQMAPNEFLTTAHGMGLDHEDFAILFEVLARMSGLSKSPNEKSSDPAGGVSHLEVPIVTGGV